MTATLKWYKKKKKACPARYTDAKNKYFSTIRWGSYFGKLSCTSPIKIKDRVQLTQ